MAEELGNRPVLRVVPPPPEPDVAHPRPPAARFTSVFLGAWLFVSGFLWAHTGVSQVNTWIMGVVISGIAITALVVPQVRHLNAASGAWLLLSTVVLPQASNATAWHDAVVAVGVFIAALQPRGRAARVDTPANRRATV